MSCPICNSRTIAFNSPWWKTDHFASTTFLIERLWGASNFAATAWVKSFHLIDLALVAKHEGSNSPQVDQQIGRQRQVQWGLSRHVHQVPKACHVGPSWSNQDNSPAGVSLQIFLRRSEHPLPRLCSLTHWASLLLNLVANRSTCGRPASRPGTETLFPWTVCYKFDLPSIQFLSHMRKDQNQTRKGLKRGYYILSKLFPLFWG